MINHYKNLLASEGIPTQVRNQHLGSIMGEMPFFETWPQLWVVNDLDFDRATQLIESADAESPTEPWTCRKCKEVASHTVSFTEFQKSGIKKQKQPDRACCDKCWHLWAPCIKCKRMLPRADFADWMNAHPSRRHTGKTVLLRCNICVREDKDSAAQLSQHDVSVVMQKRKRNT